MEHINNLQVIITFIASVVTALGGCFVMFKNTIKDTINEVLATKKEKFEEKIKELTNSHNNDIEKIENKLEMKLQDFRDDYVTCKFCNMQHDNLNILMKSMNDKLDILIGRNK